MRRSGIPGVLLAAIIALLPVCMPVRLSADGVAPLRTLEGLVGRWVELRGQADAEQRAWTAQAAQWRQEMELLEAERLKLAAALETMEETGDTRRERGAAMLAEQARLVESLAGVEAAVARLQPALEALRLRVPASLMSHELETALAGGAVATDAVNEGAVARLQRALGALKMLEELQGGIHVSREMVALPEGARREMDVIYFGLACGFAVASDGGMAASGASSPDGWRWDPEPALASGVRRLLRIANRDDSPALAVFPVGTALPLSAWRSEGDGAQ